MPIDKKILEDYVATANSGKYGSLAEVNDKFPELKGYDPKLLEDYVATANSGKYGSIDEVNAKFPEFDSEPSKKKVLSEPMVGFPGSKDYKLLSESGQEQKLDGTTQNEKTDLSQLNPAAKINLYENALGSIDQRQKQVLIAYNQAKEQGDEQAVQKLLPQIHADNQKIQTLRKGIEGQKTIAAMKEPNTVANNLAIGLQQAVGLTGTSLKAGQDALKVLVIDAYSAMKGISEEEKKSAKEAILNMSFSPLESASNQIAKVSKPLLEKADKANQDKDLNLKYEGSPFKAFENGDYSKAAEYAAKGFVQSLPTSLTYLNPATATTSSLGMVGQETDQAQKENGTVTSSDVGAGVIKAGLELVTERMFGTGAATRSLIKKVGLPEAERIIKETTEEVVKKTLKRKLVQTYSEEVVGEVANQFGSNAVDKYIHGKDISLTQGLGDAGLIALFGGITQGTAVVSAEHFLDKNAAAKVQDLKQRSAQMMDESLHQQSHVAAQALENHAEQLNNEAENIAKEQTDIIEHAKPETINAIDDVESKIQELAPAIEQASEDAKPVLIQQVQELDQQHQDLVEQAKQEAIKKIESLKENKKGGENNAINEGIKQENNQPERQNRDESGEATTTGNSNSDVKSGEIQPEKEVAGEVVNHGEDKTSPLKSEDIENKIRVLNNNDLKEIGLGGKATIKNIREGGNIYYPSISIKKLSEKLNSSPKDIINELVKKGEDRIDLNEKLAKENGETPLYKVESFINNSNSDPELLGEFVTEAAAQKEFEQSQDYRQRESEDNEHETTISKYNPETEEYEELDSGTVDPINKASKELLYDVQSEFGNKYNNIRLPNGDTLNLRIADHSANRRNNSGERNVSIVISNMNPTERFRMSDKGHSDELYFGSDSTKEEIIDAINNRIDEIKEESEPTRWEEKYSVENFKDRYHIEDKSTGDWLDNTFDTKEEAKNHAKKLFENEQRNSEGNPNEANKANEQPDETQVSKPKVAEKELSASNEQPDKWKVETIENPKTDEPKEPNISGQKKSGFQERSIENAEDEVVKKIARENEVYYTEMHQKDQYEAAKAEFPDAQSVLDKFVTLFPDKVSLNESATLQVRRQVAMQTLSIEIAKKVMNGEDPEILGENVNKLQNALSKDFAKGGQIGAMAIWKFMTPQGIVYQLKQQIAKNNESIESKLSADQKKEISELNDKIEKLSKKLEEEIANSAKRREGKITVETEKKQKVFSEAKKTRKEELKQVLRKKFFAQFNDVTNIPAILLDKDTLEYAKLVIEEGAIDFSNFSKEMIKDFGKAIKPALVKLYAKANDNKLLDKESQKQIDDFLQKEFIKLYGTSRVPNRIKKKRKTDLDKIIEGVNSGVINDSFYKGLFLDKFGLKPELTVDETIEFEKLATAVTSLPPTSKLYNVAVMNMAQFINNHYPRNWWSDLSDVWVALNYAQMLSGVSTHILNLISTSSGILNSPFRNAVNMSKILKAVKMGVKEKSLSTFMVYNPVYGSVFITKAWAEGAKEGKRIAAATMTEGATTDKYIEGLANDLGKVSIPTLEQKRYGNNRFKGGKLNPYNAAKYVGRSLAAEDGFMFQTAYEGEIAGLALDIYRKQGLRGKKLENAVNSAYLKNKVNVEEVKKQLNIEVENFKLSGKKLNPRDIKIRESEIAVDQVLKQMGATKEEIDETKRLALNSTFNDDRFGAVSRLAQLMGAAANFNRATQLIIKPFVPFTKVVGNVADFGLDFTPGYGFARAHGWGVTGIINRALKSAGHEGFKTSQLGENKTRAYYEQMGRAWFGTIAFITAAAMAAGNDEDDWLQITGGYDEETMKRKTGREKVTPKYSVRMGDFVWSYLNIPPLQVTLSLIGNYNDYKHLHKYDEDELNERLALAYAAGASATMVKDMTFVQGIQDLIEMATNVISAEGNKLETAGKALFSQYFSYAARPLPQNNNLVLQAEKFFDPTSYSRKEIKDITAYSLGLQHIFGRPNIDIMGDEIKSYPSESTIPYTHWLKIVQADKEWKFMSRYNAIQPRLINSKTKVFNNTTGLFELRTLNADEFFDYAKLTGKLFREKLQKYEIEVDAEKRVKEHNDGLNGVNYDMTKLFNESKAEAKQKLINKSLTPEQIRRGEEIKAKELPEKEREKKLAVKEKAKKEQELSAFYKRKRIKKDDQDFIGAIDGKGKEEQEVLILAHGNQKKMNTFQFSRFLNILNDDHVGLIKSSKEIIDLRKRYGNGR